MIRSVDKKQNVSIYQLKVTLKGCWSDITYLSAGI